MGEHYDREFKNYGTAVNNAGAENAMAGAATALANGDQAEFERWTWREYEVQTQTG
jgi:hypothetical protein